MASTPYTHHGARPTILFFFLTLFAARISCLHCAAQYQYHRGSEEDGGAVFSARFEVHRFKHQLLQTYGPCCSIWTASSSARTASPAWPLATCSNPSTVGIGSSSAVRPRFARSLVRRPRLAQSLTRSLAQSLSRSLAHSLTRSLAHSLRSFSRP